MRHRIGLATACLHISAVLYLLIGVGFFVLFMAMPEGTMLLQVPLAVGMLVFCLILVVGIEFVVAGLHRRRFWAWVAGLCIFGIYVPSAFLPLGALGLWGLLDAGSREEFGVGGPPGNARRTDRIA